MLPPLKQVLALAARQPARLVMIVVVVLVLGTFVSPSPKTQSAELPANVQARLPLHTPVSDELLYELEKDFVELLQQSKNAEALLKAEELLITTNDNTHWTNYAAGLEDLTRHARSCGGSPVASLCRAAFPP